jgi:hypothetical protein
MTNTDENMTTTDPASGDGIASGLGTGVGIGDVDTGADGGILSGDDPAGTTGLGGGAGVDGGMSDDDARVSGDGDRQEAKVAEE